MQGQRLVSVEVYQLAPQYPDEARRERAVEASGALDAANDAGLLEIVLKARRAFQTSMAAISIVYRDWQYLIATAGLPVGPYSRRTSFCGHVILTDTRVLCVADAMADERFAHNPAVADSHLVRFYAGAPLVDAEGLPLGALCVFDPHPRDCLREGEADCIQRLAGETMVRLRSLKRRAGSKHRELGKPTKGRLG